MTQKNPRHPTPPSRARAGKLAKSDTHPPAPTRQTQFPPKKPTTRDHTSHPPTPRHVPKTFSGRIMGWVYLVPVSGTPALLKSAATFGVGARGAANERGLPSTSSTSVLLRPEPASRPPSRSCALTAVFPTCVCRSARVHTGDSGKTPFLALGATRVIFDVLTVQSVGQLVHARRARCAAVLRAKLGAVGRVVDHALSVSASSGPARRAQQTPAVPGRAGEGRSPECPGTGRRDGWHAASLKQRNTLPGREIQSAPESWCRWRRGRVGDISAGQVHRLDPRGRFCLFPHCCCSSCAACKGSGPVVSTAAARSIWPSSRRIGVAASSSPSWRGRGSSGSSSGP